MCGVSSTLGKRYSGESLGSTSGSVVSSTAFNRPLTSSASSASLIDDGAARGVDERRAVLHQRELARAEHVARFRQQRYVHRRDVGVRQQFRQADLVCAEFAHLQRRQVRVVHQHLHVERSQQFEHFATDVRRADHADGFFVVADVRRFLGPRRAVFVIAAIEIGEPQHLFVGEQNRGERVLGHRHRIGGHRVGDLYAHSPDGFVDEAFDGAGKVRDQLQSGHAGDDTLRSMRGQPQLVISTCTRADCLAQDLRSCETASDRPAGKCVRVVADAIRAAALPSRPGCMINAVMGPPVTRFPRKSCLCGLGCLQKRIQDNAPPQSEIQGTHVGVKLTKQSIDLGIIVKDGPAALAFYRDRAGLQARRRHADAGRRHDASTAVRRKPDQGRRSRKGTAGCVAPGRNRGATGYRYWTISVSNISELVAACAKAGRNVVVPEREIRPGIRIAIVEDPDGNWVEFLQQG